MKTQSSVCFSIALIVLAMALYGSHSSGKLWEDTPILFRYHSSHPAYPVEIDPTTGYLEIDSSDPERHRKILYNKILLALDSVHKICDDPRVDSIWRFVRPQMTYTNDLSREAPRPFDKIYILPLRTGEDHLGRIERIGRLEKLGAVYNERTVGGGMSKSIAVYDLDQVPFSTLAIVFYHEAYHAGNSAWGSKSGEESEHAEIFTLECVIFATLMNTDSVLRNYCDASTFTEASQCQMKGSNLFLNLSERETWGVLSWMHGCWLIKKNGIPTTESERLELYRKARQDHSIIVS